MPGPEQLRILEEAWQEDLARLEKCRRDVTNEYIPRLATMNAKLTEALFKIQELEKELEKYKSSSP